MAHFAPAPIKPIVGLAALEALDIRVGTIERVEEIPRSDKLMRYRLRGQPYARACPARAPRSERRSCRLNVQLRSPHRLRPEDATRFDPSCSTPGFLSCHSDLQVAVFRGSSGGICSPFASATGCEGIYFAASFCAAEEISAASFSITCETTTIASSACFHCFSSIASRTAGTVFTAYPV